MKQTIEIEVPDGKEAVWKDGKVVFEDIKPQLPRTWEEFCKNYPPKKGECYMDLNCQICSIVYDSDNRNKDFDRNILPSKQAAEAHLAYMMLHQLRDAWREGWVPDWKNDYQDKYVIINMSGNHTVVTYQYIVRFLAFQDEKTANEFLTNFRELIEQAGDLI